MKGDTDAPQPKMFGRLEEAEDDGDGSIRDAITSFLRDMGHTVLSVLNILNQIREVVSSALSGWLDTGRAASSQVQILPRHSGDTLMAWGWGAVVCINIHNNIEHYSQDIFQAHKAQAFAIWFRCISLAFSDESRKII